MNTSVLSTLTAPYTLEKERLTTISEDVPEKPIRILIFSKII